jgi:hypothetical protein
MPGSMLNVDAGANGRALLSERRGGFTSGSRLNLGAVTEGRVLLSEWRGGSMSGSRLNMDEGAGDDNGWNGVSNVRNPGDVSPMPGVIGIDATVVAVAVVAVVCRRAAMDGSGTIKSLRGVTGEGVGCWRCRWKLEGLVVVVGRGERDC